MANLLNYLLAIFVALTIVPNFSWRGDRFVRGETIPLSAILPKIQAIHEDVKSLLIKNVELKNKILAGIQNEAQKGPKIITVKEGESISTKEKQSKQQSPNPEQALSISSMTKEQKMAAFPGSTSSSSIDYGELEEFNKWVEMSLEYAVKNTQATAEALKEEAQSNGGNVEYTDQAVKDGIEGVKYWQATVIYQDKTLKNEKFDPQLD